MDTRPATKTEAAKIAADFRAKAAYHRETARRLYNVQGRTAAERVADNGGHPGPECIEMQHADGRMVSLARKKAMHEESMAYKLEGQAEAWDRVAAGPEGAAWEETRKEYEDRVKFYADRLGLTAGSTI